MTGSTDLTLEAFTILREHFFDQDGAPKPFPLREKRNTQDNPLDEYICGMLRNHLQDSECVPAPGPLINPDLVLLRPDRCNSVHRAALRDDLTRIVGVEVKKLERTKSGSVARRSGLDYNTPPLVGRFACTMRMTTHLTYGVSISSSVRNKSQAQRTPTN